MAKNRSSKINKGNAGQNRKTGQGFLDKYRNKPGVTETDSGLLYRVLEPGSGTTPTASDQVITHQRVLNSDNTVIEDSYQTGLPDQYAIKDAIPGLQEGLQLMKEGARFEFVVPPELGWGRRGVNNKIGPNAVLVMDVRLLEVLFG